MQITYLGSNEMIFSASVVFAPVLHSGEPLSYLAREDLKIHSIEEIIVSEGAFGKNEPLAFGEWRYCLSDSRVVIEGASILETVKAIHAFLRLIEASKENPISWGYHFGYQYHVLQKPFVLGQNGISAYRIFYMDQEKSHPTHGEDFFRYPPARQAALDLADFIGRECGVLLHPMPLGKEEMPEDAIVIAPFPDGQEARKYGDWSIETKGHTVFVLANDICGWESGISRLCQLLVTEKSLVLPLFLSGTLQKREQYESNPDTFLPCYQGRLTLQVLSIIEKAKKLSEPVGEPFIIAHRGEHSYYPENSLEASLSAWRCGADSTEVDLGLTRDGIFVLMHDDTLSRTTDVLEKKGKNGLPNSLLLSDWSLEELRQLRLKDTHGKLTDFLIPTLEELFLCCNGRIFLHLDKKFDYRKDIFPLMRKCKAYRCIYLCNHIDFDGIAESKNEFLDQNLILPSLLRIPQQKSKKLEQSLNQVLESEGAVSPAVVFINDYSKYLPQHKKLISQYKGKLRIASWMMWETDSPSHWMEAADFGFNVFMTNFPIRLRQSL